jgi:glycosyltransferase involved in cell wall biosynthesis
LTVTIHAPNIHSGGGRALLLAVIKSVVRLGQPFRLIVDERLDLNSHELGMGIAHRVRPSLYRRILAEFWLSSLVEPDDTVICFGNLPPLLGAKGRVTVFLQNRYLVDSLPLHGFSSRTRTRLKIERMWLRYRFSTKYRLVVQTATMARLAKLRLGVQAQVMPFADLSPFSGATGDRISGAEGGFTYIASGEPHKNHRNLVEAWCLLATEGCRPKLTLTVAPDSFPALCRWMESLSSQYGLQIVNLGKCGRNEVNYLYLSSCALIYPSLYESFGLPLLEAQQFNLPIIAAERDYVRDVVIPLQTFDPESPMSIVRSIKRFLGIEERPRPAISAEEFLDAVLWDGNL